MKEIHGLAGVEKVAMFDGDTQAVRVTDAGNRVHLSLSTSSFPAALTPEEARFIATQLVAAAQRIVRKAKVP